MMFIVPRRLTVRPLSSDPNGCSGRRAKLCWLDQGKWRRGWDSNPRYGFSPYNGLANRRLQPLGHPSTDEWIDAGYAIRPLARAHQAAQDGRRKNGSRIGIHLAPNGLDHPLALIATYTEAICDYCTLATLRAAKSSPG